MSGGRKRVALVIGSGSVKCAAAIGIQKALTRAGIGLDMVVGCSAGAIFAATIATGQDADATAEMARRLWTREVASKRNRHALLSILSPRMFGFRADKFGLRDDKLILRQLREAFGTTAIEDMPIPLHITATDFSNGEQVVLSSGSVADAVRASVALPFAFAPVRLGDKLLTDGYLSDPMPVGVAIRQGADVIIAAGFESPYQTSVNSAARFAFQFSSIMSNNLLKSNFAFHSLAHHGEVIPILPQFEQRVRLFDSDKIPYVIEVGERAAEEQLPYLRELLAMAPVAATA
jgi:NTE family protein